MLYIYLVRLVQYTNCIIQCTPDAGNGVKSLIPGAGEAKDIAPRFVDVPM